MAIIASNLGLSVSVDDKGLRVTFPELTTESRNTFVKLAKVKLEESRVTLRAERDKVWNDIQAREKEGGMGEDEKFRLKEKRIRARIASTDVFSSHPGSDEIFEYITATSNKNKSSAIETKIFLVHGEESQMSLMQNRLFEIGLMQVEMPYQGQEYKL